MGLGCTFIADTCASATARNTAIGAALVALNAVLVVSILWRIRAAVASVRGSPGASKPGGGATHEDVFSQHQVAGRKRKTRFVSVTYAFPLCCCSMRNKRAPSGGGAMDDKKALARLLQNLAVLRHAATESPSMTVGAFWASVARPAVGRHLDDALHRDDALPVAATPAKGAAEGRARRAPPTPDEDGAASVAVADGEDRSPAPSPERPGPTMGA